MVICSMHAENFQKSLKIFVNITKTEWILKTIDADKNINCSITSENCCTYFSIMSQFDHRLHRLLALCFWCCDMTSCLQRLWIRSTLTKRTFLLPSALRVRALTKLRPIIEATWLLWDWIWLSFLVIILTLFENYETQKLKTWENSYYPWKTDWNKIFYSLLKMIFFPRNSKNALIFFSYFFSFFLIEIFPTP